MNDRFRFRAWDKVREQYEDCKVFINTNGKLIGFYTRDERLDEFYNVEQCTGLKDKNGKLIYEGDIVAVILANGKLEDIGCVKYGYFNCSCCDGVYGWGFGDADIRNYDRYTIVGNIHENPEMIDENH